MKKELKQRARTEEEKGKRRLKILESARKLFSIHGYHRTTIEMITDDAFQCGNIWELPLRVNYKSGFIKRGNPGLLNHSKIPQSGVIDDRLRP